VDSVEESGAADVVLATDGQPDDTLLDALLRCQERGLRIVGFAQLYEETLQRVPVEHVDREWLLTSFAEAISTRDASRIVKRAFDIAGALGGLVLSVVAAPVIAAAILLEDGRPVIFRQTRVGRGGALFDILKFRTMVRDAEKDEGPRWAAADDPRVTRAGRFLRRTRLDELPNLLNVLRGEMSLVGPRPLPLRDYDLLEDWHRKRYLVLPGMTGLWQISGRSGLTFDDLVRLDFYYLDNWSIWLDISILVKTPSAVVARKGAY